MDTASVNVPLSSETRSIEQLLAVIRWAHDVSRKALFTKGNRRARDNALVKINKRLKEFA